MTGILKVNVNGEWLPIRTVMGPTGPAGEGATGPVGPTGPAGEGATGPTGPIGPTGSQVEVVEPSPSAPTGKAADAKATGDALAAKAEKSDVELIPVYSWTIVPAYIVSEAQPTRINLLPGGYVQPQFWDGMAEQWDDFGMPKKPNGMEPLTWTPGEESEYEATATPTGIVGYAKSDQPDRVLQPQGDYATEADATLAPTYSWTFEPATYNDHPIRMDEEVVEGTTYYTPMAYFNGEYNLAKVAKTMEAGSDTLTWSDDVEEGPMDVPLTATRRLVGYKLGAQADKPLQPAGEYAPATDIPKSALAQAVQTSLGKADTAVQPAALSGKLDSTSAAPAFSADSSVSYAVGSHVTYNGKLYKCTTATTGGTWVAASWTEDTMTDPDAVLDITSQNRLRVMAKDGTLLWAQGYDLASASAVTLGCDKVNLFAFAATSVSAFSDAATYSVDDRVTYGGKTYKCTTAVESAGAWTGSANWTEDPDVQAFTLPSAAADKVGDFGLDIDNTANAATSMSASLTGLDSTFSVVVPKGENLADMLTFEPGEMAELYFTLTAFRVNNLPTWHIVKQIVENGGATA